MSENRFLKGLRLYQDGRVQPLGDGLYRVQGIHGFYTVDLRGRACTCPDFLHRGGTCKHLYAAMFFIGELEAEAYQEASIRELINAPVKLSIWEENVI